MVYFQSHTVTLRLWSYVWLGDVIKMNGQCLYLWQKSQVPSWPYDRRLSIPVAGFYGDNKEQRKRISVTGRLVIHSHPGLSTRALKQLGKMKFWEYPWISITVFVLFRTPMNIHSWCGNAVEVYKEPPWFSASSPGPTWSAPFYYRQLWFLRETCLLPVRLKKTANSTIATSFVVKNEFRKVSNGSLSMCLVPCKVTGEEKYGKSIIYASFIAHSQEWLSYSLSL